VAAQPARVDLDQPAGTRSISNSLQWTAIRSSPCGRGTLSTCSGTSAGRGFDEALIQELIDTYHLSLHTWIAEVLERINAAE
jgi:hypothetical protein